MRIGIISDTHNKVERTAFAVRLLKKAGAKVLFHCGDLSNEAIVEVCSQLPFYFVFGNHDSDMVQNLIEAAKEKNATCLGWGDEVEFDNKRVAISHGHLTSDLRPLIDSKPDYLFTGHSHQKEDRVEFGIRRINPGALHRAKTYTAALLELSSGELEWIEIPK